MPPLKVIVTGIGAYLPGEKISAEEIDCYVGIMPGWNSPKYYHIIEKFAGIKYRHYAIERETGKLLEDSPCLAKKAAMSALERAGIQGSDLDLIITTTTSPPYLRGGLAKEVRILLGNEGCATYDLWGACTGIHQAITLATACIRVGMFRNALLVGVELISTGARAENYSEKRISREDMLIRGDLGDGAGALVLCGSDSPDDEDGILYARSGTEGAEPSVFHREAGGSTLPLNEATFHQGLFHWHHDFERMVRKGVPYFIEIVKRTLTGASIQIEDVDFIVPAAANLNYFKTEEFLEGMTCEERDLVAKIRSKTFTNFSTVGNVAAAAVYIALNELYEKGCLGKDARLLLASVEGATWGWGGSLFRWNGPTISVSKTIANTSC